LLGKAPNPIFDFRLITGLLIIAFVVAKMVGLESVTFGAGVFQLRVVASLLPLAMVFRRYGVLGISIGCPLAHLMATGRLENAFFAFASALGGSVSSYLVYRRSGTLMALFAGALVITFFWTTAYGSYFSVASGIPLLDGLADTLSSLWIGVNVVGFASAVAVRVASRSWDANYARN